jgi:phycocyanobilin lyase beta subunit
MMTTSASAELATLIQAVNTADSKAGIVMAVRELAAAQDDQAIPTLIEVLGYNNPGAAVAAIEGLVALGSRAVPTLLEQLDSYNYGARAWAIRALALIGDPRALPVLLETANNDFALSVRRAAAKGIGAVDWSQLPEDQRYTSQIEVLQTLLHTSAQDAEWVVRYAAIVGLQSLAAALASPAQERFEKILDHLQWVSREDAIPAVQARAHLAYTQLSQ